jgi:hypothetical protein
MGVRTRGLDIKAGAMRNAADRAARAEADIQRWNEQLALGRDMLWSPTIRAAVLAGTPRLGAAAPAPRSTCERSIAIRSLGTWPRRPHALDDDSCRPIYELADRHVFSPPPPYRSNSVDRAVDATTATTCAWRAFPSAAVCQNRTPMLGAGSAIAIPLPQQLRQPRKVHRHTPRLVAL